MYPSNMAEVVITQATNADFKIDMSNSECKQTNKGKTEQIGAQSMRSQTHRGIDGAKVAKMAMRSAGPLGVSSKRPDLFSQRTGAASGQLGA